MAVAPTRKGKRAARRGSAQEEARKSPRRDPKQERSEETIRILLDATELTLLDVGLERATTGAIAARAGLSAGTLFHYFPTKAAILAAWEERMIVRVGEIAIAELSRLVETDPPLDYCIRRLVHVGCTLHVQHLTRCGLLASHASEKVVGLARLEPRLAMAVRAAELLTSALAHAVDAHLLRPKDWALSVVVALKATIVMSYIGAAHHAEQMRSGAFQEELGSLVCRYLLGDAADLTPREALDPTANLPQLPSVRA